MIIIIHDAYFILWSAEDKIYPIKYFKTIRY